MSINIFMLLEKFLIPLPQQELEILSNAIINCPNLVDENRDTLYYKNSHGYSNINYTLKYVVMIEKLVLPSINRAVKFSHTYSRIYRNGSYLSPHTDRPGLDLTLSLCVRKDTKQSWPLNVSTIPHEGLWVSNDNIEKYKSTFLSIDLEPGEAGLMEGTKYPHWRNEIVCDPDDKNIYIFYHWGYV